jgi:hypothetical protein
LIISSNVSFLKIFRISQGITKPGGAEDMAGQGQAKQGKASQGKTRQGKAKQGKARQGQAKQGRGQSHQESKQGRG